MIKRSSAIATVAFLAVFLFATATNAATPESGSPSLRVTKTDVSQFPQVKMHLSLATEKQAVNFKVRENGRAIRDVEVSSKVSKQPVDVTLLIDISGSMKGKPLDDAKAAAILFVARARAGDRIAVVAFNSTVTRAADFTDDKGALTAAIDGLVAEGDTAAYDALFESIGASQNQNERHQNLILLSDGADTASKISGESAVELAGKSNIPISIITLQSSEFDPKLLAEIADRSNGRLVNILSSEALVELYDSLASELHNRYQIAFKSRADKAKAEVEVETIVGGERLQTTTRLENLPVRTSPIAEKPKITVVQDQLSEISSLWLAAGLGFAAAFLVVLLVADLLKPSKNTLGRQLKYYDQLKGREVSNSEKLEGSKAYKSLIEAIKQVSAKYDFADYAKVKLEQAGLPIRPNEYMAMHLLIVVALSFATILLTSSLFMTFLIIAATVILPLLGIQVKIGSRNKEFDEQLPETLDLLASSMRAGFGLQQAIVSAGEEAKPPMGQELKRVANQTQMGMTLESSLRKMAERIGNKSLKWVVLAIAIHQETGGNLAEILDNLAESLRQRQTVYRQIKALTAEGRLSAIILFVLPFIEALILFYFNPDYMITLVTTAPGILMLMAAITLMFLGGLWFRKITNIEY